MQDEGKKLIKSTSKSIIQKVSSSLQGFFKEEIGFSELLKLINDELENVANLPLICNKEGYKDFKKTWKKRFDSFKKIAIISASWFAQPFIGFEQRQLQKKFSLLECTIFQKMKELNLEGYQLVGFFEILRSSNYLKYLNMEEVELSEISPLGKLENNFHVFEGFEMFYPEETRFLNAIYKHIEEANGFSKLSGNDFSHLSNEKKGEFLKNLQLLEFERLGAGSTLLDPSFSRLIKIINQLLLDEFTQLCTDENVPQEEIFSFCKIVLINSSYLNGRPELKEMFKENFNILRGIFGRGSPQFLVELKTIFEKKDSHTQNSIWEVPDQETTSKQENVESSSKSLET